MIEDEKVINKLNWVIEEIKRELENRSKDDIEYKDLVQKLEKVIKNCETSISLIKEYNEIYYQRAASF